MPRRVNLTDTPELLRGAPSASELTTETPDSAVVADQKQSMQATASGRVRHDEKITVYVSRDELLALELGRLSVRRDYALAIDRGRLVRESIAIVMEDLAANGEQSELVKRLRAR